LRNPFWTLLCRSDGKDITATKQRAFWYEWLFPKAGLKRSEEEKKNFCISLFTCAALSDMFTCSFQVYHDWNHEGEKNHHRQQ
jgi:hypothetical protein